MNPNILIIYPDQMRADAMRCAGNTCIRTPNLDQLAAEGVRFENAFNSFPLCCPFRASIMTGKYPHSNGMYANHYPIPLGQDFLAEILRDNGYQTGYFGKWHLNGGRKHDFVAKHDRLGFETFVGFSRGHRYFDSIYYRGDDAHPRTSKRFEPDFQTDQLIEFMDDTISHPEPRPFFGMISYGTPHPPMVAPEEYLGRYLPGEVPIKENTPDAKGIRSKARRVLARYYGLIANFDDNVGRIMNWMDRAGVAGNTMVIVVSDHGEMAGENGRFGKKSYYRGSMQVPLIVRYPDRFMQGQIVPQLVDPSVDTMPTLLELCGIPVPDAVQGVSFLPMLAGERQPVRSAVHYEVLKQQEGPEKFPNPQRGIRTREWLYVRTKEAPVALFDLKKDPLEMNNLVQSEQHAEIREGFDQEIAAHMTDTDDLWDLEAIFPPPDFQTHGEGRLLGERFLESAIVEA